MALGAQKKICRVGKKFGRFDANLRLVPDHVDIHSELLSLSPSAGQQCLLQQRTEKVRARCLELKDKLILVTADHQVLQS